MTPSPDAAATAPVRSEATLSSAATQVVDDQTPTSSGQMQKSQFLAELRAEVSRGASEELGGTGRTTEDCPWIAFWFGYYEQRDAAHIERALHRYTPEAVTAGSAREYITIVTQRVRRAVAIWSATGEVTGLPAGIETPASVRTSPAAVGIAFKRQNGNPGQSRPDPQGIRSRLGSGQPMESGVRSRMESAFGTDLSGIRVHTDSRAGNLSTSLSARAFTIGSDVAFAGGEYRPGTLVGDALIAHELAHVMQQRGQQPTFAPSASDNAQGYDLMEADADRSAAGAVLSIWGGVRGKLSDLGRNALPHLRSGLRLQRCGQNRAPTNTPTVSIGNFRNSGNTGGENNCGLCPLPLGVLPGSGKNRMELRGDITGHHATAAYDFKRTKERGTWKLAGGTWTQVSHVGPGEDDDGHDQDEDLTPENNHIYTEDGPGFRNLGDPFGDATTTEAVYKASFIEFANVRVGSGSWSKSSNDYQWHSITWLEKVGGSWQRKAGANEIASGSTTVGTGNP